MFAHLYSRNTSVALILSVIFSLTLAACGGGGGSSSSSSSSTSYAGPGSKWDVTLNSDNTFVITYAPDSSSPVDLTVNGTYQDLASGFKLLTVTSATGTGAPSPGDTAWGLEVPGYAFFLRPIDDTNEQLIPMITAGECPTGDFTGNWVIVKKADGADASDSGRDFWGTFSFNNTTGVATLPSKYDLQTYTAQPVDVMDPGTCSDGVMELGSADAVMYLTSDGGAIVHTEISTPADSSFIFALNDKAITNVNNVDGDYAGILFDDNMADGSKINNLTMTCTAGACTATIVTDIVTNTVSSDSVTINVTGPDAFEDGFITGTITDGSMNSGNLACMVDISVLGGSDKIISCVGQSPGDNTDMFNALFVSK